jgi:hypothetical protein
LSPFCTGHRPSSCRSRSPSCTFIRAPPVTSLQRWIGGVPAVLLVITLVFAALGLVGWGLSWQMDHLVEDLPGYRANIRTKIADVRLVGRGSAAEKLQRDCDRHAQHHHQRRIPGTARHRDHNGADSRPIPRHECSDRQRRVVSSPLSAAFSLRGRA